MRHLLLAVSVLLPSLAGAAQPSRTATAPAEVRAGIRQAQVPASVKARATRALNSALAIDTTTGPRARANAGTASWSAEGSPFISNVGTVGGQLRSGGVSFRGIAQRTNLPGPFAGSTHGVSWATGKETASGLITTTGHDVAPIGGGRFVEQVQVSRSQRSGVVERSLGTELRFHLLSSTGKRTAEVTEDWARQQASAFRSSAR